MKLTEKTTIPLFAVVSSVPFLIGGIMWLSFISFKADQASAKVEKQEVLLQEIKDAVTRIEIALENQHLQSKREKK